MEPSQYVQRKPGAMFWEKTCRKKVRSLILAGKGTGPEKEPHLQFEALWGVFSIGNPKSRP